MKHECKNLHNITRPLPAYFALLPFTKLPHFPSCPTHLSHKSSPISSFSTFPFNLHCQLLHSINPPPYYRLTSMKSRYLMALLMGALVCHCAVIEALTPLAIIETASEVARVSGLPLGEEKPAIPDVVAGHKCQLHQHHPFRTCLLYSSVDSLCLCPLRTLRDHYVLTIKVRVSKR